MLSKPQSLIGQETFLSVTRYLFGAGHVRNDIGLLKEGTAQLERGHEAGLLFSEIM